MSALDPMMVMESLNANLNRHDLVNSLDLFADDAVVKIEPAPPSERGVYQGKEEIRAWLQGLLRENLHIKASSFQVTGNEISWQAEISADRYRNMGIDPLKVSGHAVLWGALIKSYELHVSPESAEKMKQAAAQRQPA